MRLGRSNKSYIRDLQKWQSYADQMPSKDWKRFKRAERQRGKAEIRNALKEPDMRDPEYYCGDGVTYCPRCEEIMMEYWD